MIDSSLIFNVLISFGAFQALFLSIIFFTKNNGSLPKKFFALFLTIEGVTLIERLLAETGLIESVPHLLGISYPASFIKAPILFLMTLAITNTKFRLRSVHYLHFIPFMMILVMNIPFYLQTAQYKLDIVATFITYVPAYRSFDFWFFLSFFLHIGIYLFASILRLNKYQLHIKNNTLANWYLWVLYLYSISLLISFVYFIIRPSGWIDIPLINIVSMLIMTFLIQSIAYSFLTKENILTQNNNRFLNDVNQLIHDENLILSKLKVEKIFLNDTLNLKDFAQSVDLSKKYVSDLINQKFGHSFKELINKYRVEEAKELMKKDIDSKIQLIDIAQESGFNNKVSFYRAFKRYSGKSPSDYFHQIRSNRSTT